MVGGKMRNLDNANIKRKMLKQKKLKFISDNIANMSHADIVEVLVSDFNCKKSSANKLIYDFLSGKEVLQVVNQPDTDKIRMDFVSERYYKMDKPDLVKLIMQEFDCHENNAYKLIRQYETKAMKDLGKQKEASRQKRDKLRAKLLIDDTDYFENSFNWKPKRRG